MDYDPTRETAPDFMYLMDTTRDGHLIFSYDHPIRCVCDVRDGCYIAESNNSSVGGDLVGRRVKFQKQHLVVKCVEMLPDGTARITAEPIEIYGDRFGFAMV